MPSIAEIQVSRTDFVLGTPSGSQAQQSTGPQRKSKDYFVAK